MKVTRTALEGVLILEPKVFGDERGFFMESFNQKTFNDVVGCEVTFVQDNQMSLPAKWPRLTLWRATRSFHNLSPTPAWSRPRPGATFRPGAFIREQR